MGLVNLEISMQMRSSQQEGKMQGSPRRGGRAAQRPWQSVPARRCREQRRWPAQPPRSRPGRAATGPRPRPRTMHLLAARPAWSTPGPCLVANIVCHPVQLLHVFCNRLTLLSHSISTCSDLCSAHHNRSASQRHSLVHGSV